MLKSSSTTARWGPQLSLSPQPLPAADAHPAVPTSAAHRFPLLRWLFPSLTDMIFVVLVGILVYAPAGAGLLNDADTGWHIRNGQHIVRTRSVPHVDYFSYTMGGKPWYAWEWLCDAGMGLLAARLGLNGIVLFTAITIGLTFALLFRTLIARCGNLLVAALLTMLAVFSSPVHMLARPHVVGWLLTLIWVRLLYRFQQGETRVLWWLPALMLVWVNVHGSFILGLVLLAIFVAGNCWTYLTSQDGASKLDARTAIVRLSFAGLASALATFITPYGHKLHVHVFGYLSNRYFMDHIMEFASPNFHGNAEKYFGALLALCLVAALLAARNLRTVDVMLVLFAGYAGLYAIRNTPTSSIIITLAIAPALSEAIRLQALRKDSSDWIRRFFTRICESGERMKNIEAMLHGHLIPIAMLVVTIGLALNGGRLHGTPVLAAHFDQRQFPVGAAEYIAAHQIHDHMFSTDRWSGYLIYRLYPDTKLFIDDRHDFYGEAFLREYLKALGAELGWREVLDKNGVTAVLVPPDAPLANVLKESSDWKVMYDDGVAILFVSSGGIT